jgi:hypothetical protein
MDPTATGAVPNLIMTLTENIAMKLEALNMQTLVAIHNALSDKPATMKTFSQRSKAIARIEKLADEQGIKLADRFNDDGSVKVVKTVDLAPQGGEETPKEDKTPNGIGSLLGQMMQSRDKKDEAPKATPKPAAKRGEKKEKGPVIRVVAEQLLLEVVTYDEDKRPYGHSYETILNRIHEQFPEGKTSVACLRWYAVHMRERGERVPNRPRAKAAPSTKAEA